MDARYVIAAAMSLRNEELNGEASPMDNDGARLVIRELEAHGFTITKTDDGAADAVQEMGGSLPPAASSSLAEDGAATPPATPTATPVGADGEMAAESASGATNTAEAPSSSSVPGPDLVGGQPGHVSPRTFELYRHVDKSGVSGTGVVAYGVQFPDGSVALRWPGEYPSTAAWGSVEAMLAIHGHSGATEVRWLAGGVH